MGWQETYVEEDNGRGERRRMEERDKDVGERKRMQKKEKDRVR